MANSNVIQRCRAVYPPARNRAQISLGNHLAKLTCITYVFENCAESLFVAPPRRCCEAYEVSLRVGVEEAEIFKDATVGWGNGVVRLVNNNEEKLFRGSELKRRLPLSLQVLAM